MVDTFKPLCGAAAAAGGGGGGGEGGGEDGGVELLIIVGYHPLFLIDFCFRIYRFHQFFVLQSMADTKEFIEIHMNPHHGP